MNRLCMQCARRKHKLKWKSFIHSRNINKQPKKTDADEYASEAYFLSQTPYNWSAFIVYDYLLNKRKQIHWISFSFLATFFSLKISVSMVIVNVVCLLQIYQTNDGTNHSHFIDSYVHSKRIEFFPNKNLNSLEISWSSRWYFGFSIGREEGCLLSITLWIVWLDAEKKQLT